jgi:hypothetical protein
MKTTVEVPDSLYHQIKAQAALQGQSIKAFFVDALREKLGIGGEVNEEQVGWRAAFGAADPEAVAEVQKIIDEEFSKVDPEDWQ